MRITGIGFRMTQLFVILQESREVLLEGTVITEYPVGGGLEFGRFTVEQQGTSKVVFS